MRKIAFAVCPWHTANGLYPVVDVVSLHSDMHANLDGGRNSGTKALFDESKVGTLVPRKFFLFILAFDDFVFIRYDECMTIFLYHVPSVL